MCIGSEGSGNSQIREFREFLTNINMPQEEKKDKEATTKRQGIFIKYIKEIEIGKKKCQEEIRSALFMGV